MSHALPNPPELLVNGSNGLVKGGLAHIQPWHGRFPSLLAGLGMVILTLWIGSVLFDRKTAVVAGLILSSSAGFFAYTHDARPDMLYIFWCTSGYAAFIAAWKSPDQRVPQALAAYAMWGAYAIDLD